jgi:hypothetical protein
MDRLRFVYVSVEWMHMVLLAIALVPVLAAAVLLASRPVPERIPVRVEQRRRR